MTQDYEQSDSRNQSPQRSSLENPSGLNSPFTKVHEDRCHNSRNVHQHPTDSEQNHVRYVNQHHVHLTDRVL